MSALGCALVRIERRAARSPARGTLIALHADGADARQLLEATERFASELDRIAPQAPRARNPFLSSASPDDPRWRDYAGYAWFRHDDAGNPEPSSFGDSLAQLETLALELHEAGRAPVYLLGRGEGARLAAELHALRPDLFEREPFVEGEDGAPSVAVHGGARKRSGAKRAASRRRA